MDRRRPAKLLIGSATRLDVVCWFESNQHGLHFTAGAISQGLPAHRTAVGQALDDLVEAGLLMAQKGPRGWPEYRRLDSPLWGLMAALAPAIDAATGAGDSPATGVGGALVPMPLPDHGASGGAPLAGH